MTVSLSVKKIGVAALVWVIMRKVSLKMGVFLPIIQGEHGASFTKLGIDQTNFDISDKLYQLSF